MEFKDYYKVMGVPRDATDAQIKQAYRKLARKYHPDVSKEKNAEARFKEVGEAYEVLKNARIMISWARTTGLEKISDRRPIGTPALNSAVISVVPAPAGPRTAI